MRTANAVLDQHTRVISVNVLAHICHTAFNVFIGCVRLHVSTGVFNGSETAPVIAASVQQGFSMSEKNNVRKVCYLNRERWLRAIWAWIDGERERERKKRYSERKIIHDSLSSTHYFQVIIYNERIIACVCVCLSVCACVWGFSHVDPNLLTFWWSLWLLNSARKCLSEYSYTMWQIMSCKDLHYHIIFLPPVYWECTTTIFVLMNAWSKNSLVLIQNIQKTNQILPS